MKEIKEFNITRIEKGEGKKVNDTVAIERNITLYLNNEEFITLMCTPVMIKELSVGLLLSEKMVSEKGDIKEIDFDEVDGIVSIKIRDYSKNTIEKIAHATLTSGCGRGLATDFLKGFTNEQKVVSSLRIPAKEINDIARDFINMSSAYKETGGVHSAALWDGGRIEAFCEDIGRHNAVDKVFGYCLLNDILLKDKIILTSGRISSDILLKVSRRGIPVIISRNAPTSLSVEMAYFLGITLVGFVRGDRMNVYTHTSRVIFS
ncbi:MAG: formate dehydrogenase accessory sulfurtransferase FdhD [Nitrospirae bacterium]|nr:formate dehydrogenase accessory sulfurtransferase FdhD [Nitrospirota bacterium]